MSEMIERVAMAIMTANEQSTGLKFSDLCRDMARAAIEAMREPTEEMNRAGVDASLGYDYDKDIKAVWCSMIDRALEKIDA